MTTRTAPPSVRPRLVAACWTWAGDAEPGRPGPADIDDVLDRVRAASGAGWDGLGFHDHDLATVRETIGFPGLREVLRDAGIDIVEVEFLDDWWRADADPGIEALLLDAAGALGARLIKAGVPSHEELADIGAEVVASRLARLGDRAGQSGTQVALEAMGEPGTLDITEVVELVSHAASPFCGAVVDNFQLAKVSTSRSELCDLDWSRVLSVELGDATGSGHDITERCIPGDGDIALPAFIRDVEELGWTGCWGVEIISSQLRELPQREGVRLVRDRILAAFTAAH